MFYLRPSQSYYSPRHSYAPEPEPYISPDELARARYLRALQEQRAAREAYANSIAERELRRLEEEADDGYAPRHPHLYRQPSPVDEDEDESAYEHGYNDWASALRAQQLNNARAREAAIAAEQERRRALAAAAEEKRQRALAAAAEEQRQRALAAAAEEQRRKARAYEQAQAYADAFNEQRMKPAHRKLGRVTPDTRPAGMHPLTPKHAEPADKPVRIPVRGSSPPRAVPVHAPASQPTPAPVAEPAPAESAPSALPESALSAISTVESTLASLRSSFALPASLDFAAPRELSYASQNAPIRAYEHQLGLLLEKLDEVESAGVAEIRKERKRVVGLVESALEDVEKLVKEEWKKAHPEELEETVVAAEPEASEKLQEGEETPDEAADDASAPAPAAEPVSAAMEVEVSAPESQSSAAPAAESALPTDNSGFSEDDAHLSHAQDEMDVEQGSEPIVEEPMSDAEGESTMHESIIVEPPSTSEPERSTVEAVAPHSSIDSAPEPALIEQDATHSSPPVLTELPDSQPASEATPAPSEPATAPATSYPPQQRLEDYEML